MTELVFKGKEFVYNHHLTVPFRPLVIEAAKGVGEPDLNGNLIIHGDNLHALKALLPTHAGKVDCIYIDPPYNTGNEGWCYNDNVNSPMIKEWLKANPIGIEDGLRHDKWASMMWPRLRLLRELLSDEGLIFISINSIEQPLLRAICDEIFGSQNFVGEMIWKSRQNKDNRNESGLSDDHEFILVYGSTLDGELRSAADYENPDGDNRGPWASGNMVGLASREARPNLHYNLINPETGIDYGCPRRGWRFEPNTMSTLIEDRRIIWPKKVSGRPRQKVFLSEMTARTNASSVIGLPIFTRNGSAALSAIMPDADFAFPKPPELIQHLLSLFERKDLTVLDSFAGSASTGHAVLAANRRDAGSRKFILVEGESYADTLTAERIRRVIGGYAFTGTQREELLREPLTWTKLKNATALHEKVQRCETLDAPRFDRIKTEVKDGALIVTGERDVTEKAPGLGGSFTYCTLGAPIDMEGLLTGAELPSLEAVASLLHLTATSKPLDPGDIKPAPDVGEGVARIGAGGGRHLWLIYRPHLEWLKSGAAALTLTRARAIAAASPGDHLVFAPAKFVSRELLASEKLAVEYAPLPFALYRVETA